MVLIGNRFTPAFAGSRPNEPTPAPPGPTIEINPQATLINGRRVRGQLQVNGTTDPDPNIASVEIDWGDGTPRELTIPPYIVVHEYAAEAVYALRVIAISTAQRTATAGAYVQALGDPTTLPFASFTYTPMPFATVGEPVQFDATGSQPGTGGPITTYDWDWNDGTAIETDAGPTPTHTYTAAGTRRPQLRVVDALGEWDITNRAIIIQEEEDAP